MTEFFRHPEFEEKYYRWELHNALYQGEPYRLKQADILPYYEAEKAKHGCTKAGAYNAALNRYIREELTHYVNFLSIGIRRLVTLMFKGGLNIPTKVLDMLEGAEDNIDGYHTNFDEFAKKFVVNDLLFGKAFADLMDIIKKSIL